MMDKQVTRRRQ